METQQEQNINLIKGLLKEFYLAMLKDILMVVTKNFMVKYLVVLYQVEMNKR